MRVIQIRIKKRKVFKQNFFFGWKIEKSDFPPKNFNAQSMTEVLNK